MIRPLALLLVVLLGCGHAGAEALPGAQQNEALREAQLRFELQTASSSSIEAALRRAARSTPSALVARDYLVALELLARAEGASALRIAQQHAVRGPEPRHIREAFLRGLAARSPDEAEQWLASTEKELDEDEAPNLRRLILHLEAHAEPASAMARALRLGAADPDPRSQQENNALAVMEALIYDGRFETAHTLIEKVEAADIRESLLGNLIGLTARHRPDLALAWFRDLGEGGERRSALFRVLEALATRSFKSAAEFYRGLDRAEHSPDLASTVVLHAPTLPIAEVDALLKPFGRSAEADPLVTLALSRMNELAPNDVPWAWIARIHDSHTQQDVLLNLLLPRARASLPEAQKIVAELNFLPPQARAALRERLAAEAARAGDTGRR